MFKLFRKSEKEKREVDVALQPVPAPRKSIPTVTKKPEKPSPVLAKKSSTATGQAGKELMRRRREDEKVGDKDFLLAEMQALLDPHQSGRVKGEELRHILASIGNRWNETIFFSKSGGDKACAVISVSFIAIKLTNIVIKLKISSITSINWQTRNVR